MLPYLVTAFMIQYADPTPYVKGSSHRVAPVNSVGFTEPQRVGPVTATYICRVGVGLRHD